MRFRRLLGTVDSHTAGNPTRVVMSGLPTLQGKTMLQKRNVMQAKHDSLRVMLTGEPRGNSVMHAAFLTTPCHSEAVAGVIFSSAIGYPLMCGHATIGVATTLLEMGMVDPLEPETRFCLDTPAGLIDVRAAVQDGRVMDVTFRNQPAFVAALAAELIVPDLGRMTVDVAYGGNWFVMVPVDALGASLELKHVSTLILRGRQVRMAANEQLDIRHPLTGNREVIRFTLIYGPPYHPQAQGRNVAVSGERRFDRSPCGTGTSARMATLHARGQLALHEPFKHESIIGTTFTGRLVDTTKLDAREAVVPEITGSAHITGTHHFGVSPHDPLGTGFFV